MQVYLNGEFVPLEQAKVSVLDRGFIFGDGVYELIPCYNGVPLRLPEHLRRLSNSMAEIRLRNPHDDPAWTAIIEEVIGRNGGGDVSVYLQVTRGVAPRDHAFPGDDVEPTVFVMAKPFPVFPQSVRTEGVAAVTMDDFRWRRCHIKSISLIANVLMRQQALEQDAVEAVLVRDGMVTEGSASNVFVVEESGRVLTPPKSRHLLPGITRDLVLDLIREQGIPCEEAPISLAQLGSLRELWITSSLREIQPVTCLDGNPVGDGKPGPVWRRVYEALQVYKKNHGGVS